MSANILVGVDIGGTKTAIVLSTNPPTVLTRSVFATAPELGPGHAVKSIIESVRSGLASQHLEAVDVAAIGVSCGGPLNPVLGLIEGPPNLPGWTNVEICSILEHEFGVRCFLENDANAGALAEHLFGTWSGTSNLVFLTMGTGIGAGLILNGTLYRGATFSAGEIGHVRLSESGPLGYNKAGSVEGWASGAGMANLAREAVEAARRTGERTSLTDIAENGHSGRISISAQDVWYAAQAGDEVALEIVATTGKKLGQAAAILVDLFNPELIVVGGLALRMGDAVLEPARAVVKAEALPCAAKACRILPASLGERIGDVAALCIALEGRNHGNRRGAGSIEHACS